MTKINLGDECRDTITGFTGIAVARTIWLHGCDRVTLQPKVDKDGKIPDNNTFDEVQLEVIKAKVKPKEPKITTGGPRDDKSALRRN